MSLPKDKATLKESPIQGLGVFTLVVIPKGHPIVTIDDSRLVTPDNPLIESLGEYERHCDYLAGGIDVDFICRSSPEQVYQRSCAMLERAPTRGAYALGTGNSVPDYMPQANFFALVRTALELR